MVSSTNIFFRPNDKFWDVLQHHRWRWRRYTDAGSGMGHLTRLMREKGFIVRPVDLHPRLDAEVDDTEAMDLTGIIDRNSYLDFDVADVMIFARPSHGGFFDMAARRYIDIGEVLYISKSSNIEVDLGGWSFEKLADDVGEDGEVLLRVFGPEEKLKEYHLLGGGSPGWWQKKGSRYVQENGFSGFGANGKEEILRVEKRMHAGQLDPDDARFSAKNDRDEGWLAPDGTFYGVGYAEHDGFAYNALGSSPKMLEEYGFVRLLGFDREPDGLWGMSRYGSSDRKPNAEQRKVMRKKGYKLRSWDLPDVADVTRA